MQRKTIDELTLMDDYMFAQVMRDADRLKPLLEEVLRIPIRAIRLIRRNPRRKAMSPGASVWICLPKMRLTPSTAWMFRHLTRRIFRAGCDIISQ